MYYKDLTSGVVPRTAFFHTCHGGRDVRLDGVVDAAEQSVVAFVAVVGIHQHY